MSNDLIADDEHIPVSNENFELWLRLATDNKINQNNSWNFALIDYFHDFNILREGDGVNFQKASTTLDGCMKIYSHRIESAAKDTGTLLSSLNIQSNSAAKNAERYRNANQDNNNQEDDSSDEDSGESDGEEDNANGEQPAEGETGSTQSKKKKKSKKGKRKKVQIKVKAFQTIKVKDNDRPVKLDPVFKNALTNFDEGGAKSLLTNILRISKQSKIEFDVADDHDEILNGEDDEDEEDDEPDGIHSPNDRPIDFNDLKTFINFEALNKDLDVCPSIKELKSIYNGEGNTVALIESLNLIDMARTEDVLMGDMGDVPVFDERGFGEAPLDFDLGNDHYSDEDVNFNAGIDEADTTSNTSKRTQYSLFMDGPENPDESDHNITFTKNRSIHHETETPINPYAQNRPTKHYLQMMQLYNDIGESATHWKIARLKRYSAKSFADISGVDDIDDENGKKKKKRRKEYTPRKNEEIFIDFMSDGEDLDPEDLFESSEHMSKTFLSEKDRKSGRHLLEPDTAFTAKNLAYLSLKPNQLIKILFGTDMRFQTHEDRYLDNIPADEDYFAHAYEDRERNNLLKSNIEDDNDEEEHNDILSDSILDDVNQDFGFDPAGIEGFEAPLSDPFASPNKVFVPVIPQNSSRKNAIQYAKRAKRVDVKLLKQNIWNSIEEISIYKKKRSASQFDADDSAIKEIQSKEHDDVKEHSKETNTHEDTTEESAAGSDVSNVTNKTSSTTLDDYIDEKEAIDEMHFTNVVDLMSSKYEGKAKKELSTSFCFICLLHLANEQGLTLETQDNHEDIIIHK